MLTSKRIVVKIKILQVGQGAKCRNRACEHEKRNVLVSVSELMLRKSYCKLVQAPSVVGIVPVFLTDILKRIWSNKHLSRHGHLFCERVHVFTFKMVITKRQIFQVRKLGDAAAC